MVDKVIICGLRRANEVIPMREVQQAIGRTGRSYDEPGEAVILCSPEDSAYAESCLVDETPPVESMLSGVEEAAFHVMPWIDRVHDEESFDKWYGRSLASVQGRRVRWEDVKSSLVASGCVDDEMNLTDFGRISVRMYLSPSRLLLMREKVEEIHELGGNVNPLTMSYAISFDHIPLANVEAWQLSEYKCAVEGEGCVFSNGELIQGYAYHCQMTGKTPKWMMQVVSSVKDDMPRLFSAARMVAECMGYGDMAKDMSLFGISVFKRVTLETAAVIDEFGLESRNCALELEEMGIRRKSDLRGRMSEVMEKCSDELKSELRKSGLAGILLAEEFRMMQKGENK